MTTKYIVFILMQSGIYDDHDVGNKKGNKTENRKLFKSHQPRTRQLLLFIRDLPWREDHGNASKVAICNSENEADDDGPALSTQCGLDTWGGTQHQ